MNYSEQADIEDMDRLMDEGLIIRCRSCGAKYDGGIDDETGEFIGWPEEDLCHMCI